MSKKKDYLRKLFGGDVYCVWCYERLDAGLDLPVFKLVSYSALNGNHALKCEIVISMINDVLNKRNNNLIDQKD